MTPRIEELLAHIHQIEDELEDEYRKTRDEWARRKLELADEFAQQQRRYKTGLLRFLIRSRLLVVLTAPVIYSGWIAFLMLDLFVSIYQAICFPIYRIPKVRRSASASCRSGFVCLSIPIWARWQAWQESYMSLK